MTENSPLLVGFNNKHYDQWILKTAATGWEPEEIKQLSDFLVSGGEGWDYKHIPRMYFDQYDLMDDCAQGQSLKSIECHLGMSIVESSVSFDLDRPWTPEELAEMITYCRYDVDSTDKLDDLRQAYLENKIALGKESGIAPEKALYMTNAKLTAAFLHAEHHEWYDERDYQYPSTLLREYIPQQVFDFFDAMHDESIPDEELFDRSLEFDLGGCPVKVGFGGIHAALRCYSEETTDNRVIRNADVASYYPHQMVVNGFCSRNIPNPKIYSDTIERRVAAKKAGDKVTANALKLVLNTTYGAMLNPYNPLADRKMGRSVCISGQLQLLEFASHLLAECPTLKIIQLNTDGIMVSFDKCDEPKWYELFNEWQERTGFELEEDFIRKIIQKDVSNYVEIAMDGSTKIKGPDLVRGMAAAGAFNVNNNAVIIAEALAKCLIDGTPCEETVHACNDPMKFQLVAKASGKYGACFFEYDREYRPVQKCNRVYASKDYLAGTLYKRNLKTGSLNKISGLPESCYVDNDATADISVIDKDWYVREAKRKVNAFLGIKPPKRNTKVVNKIEKALLEVLERKEG